MRLTKAFLATCLMSSVSFADNETPVTTAPAGPAATSVPAGPVAASAPVSSAAYYSQPAVAPAPANPTINADVVEQTRVGINSAYGEAGVREVGGSAGLAMAQNIRAINFSPSIGVFLADRFELSGILDVTNMKAGSSSATIYSALAEPSFHVPINDQMLGFVGVGVGASYVSELGTALAVAPRVGLDFRIGHAGILRPSLAYQYTTHNSMVTTDANGNTDVTLVAVSSALRFNLGYSTMW
jgi:opacity protein-like surface antigen